MDDFTDHLGRHNYDAVEPGRAVIEGTWADREGKAVEDVGPGETRKVRLVLRPLSGRLLRG